jgi:hypothetical protein
MKKLALLLLVLPIPAFASDVSDLRMQQAAEAKTVCTERNIGQESPNYAGCVNNYLQYRYGWKIGMRRDGSLHAVPVGSMPSAQDNNTSSRDYNGAQYSTMGR